MKILIVDKVHLSLIDILQKKGFTCTYKPEIKRNELINSIQDYSGIIIRSKIKLTKEILSKNKHLKFISRVGAGLESIDVEYAESIGIKCINAPEGNRNAVAEHCVGLILSLFNKICLSHNEIKNGKWQRETNRGIELSGKTIGLIGYGNTGSAFAKCLKGFDINVISYDKFKKNYSDGNSKEATMKEIFEQTDILSLHIPLTAETNYLINNTFLNQFEKNIYLINTSRGKIVKTSDLVGNLKKGKILGAVLDVLEYENVSFEKLFNEKNLQLNNKNTEEKNVFSYLKNSDKVILTPHVAGITYESYRKLSKITADKIIKLFN